ncbi:MAG: CoA-acylating methylmalonate-semialdehyde dehydrogenase [Gammaproteobacteria bacterium]|nr:CoA-acylating methylmalonate-semialdehyde dehydrogenase [Gammaproteobacteria bacterium]
MKQLHHLVNGEEFKGSSGAFEKVYLSATGEVACEVAMANEADTTAAIQAAHEAYPAWREFTPLKRSRIFFKYKELIEKNANKIAQMVSDEHGKVLNDAHGSLQRGIEVVEFACGIPQLLKGEYSEDAGTGIDVTTIRQPLGVCAGITPFNFPAMVPMWMFPMAIACGNTFVLKPSEKDPSCAYYLSELLYEAGLPKGVLNVVNGGKPAVDTLLTNEHVKAVSFVGSTPIARYVYETGANNAKRVQALGGAKNHMIVMPDADMDLVESAALGAGYGSAGERCMAISVVVTVGDKTADELVKRLKPLVENLKIGTAPNDDMGPLITTEHLAKVKGYVDLGVEEGAELVVDGRDFKLAGHEKGYFMGGCLFDKVLPSMKMYQEEIFGPVLAIVRVPDYETAIKLVNDHPFGNGTAIFTRDGGLARDYSYNVQVGMVGINVPIPVPVSFHSFGGWKKSLFGDMHAYGPEGVRFYTRAKAVTSRWPKGSINPEFMMPTL